MARPPRKYVKRVPRDRGVQFSQRPGNPSPNPNPNPYERSRVIQLNVTGVPDETPAEYQVNRASAHASQPPTPLAGTLSPQGGFAERSPLAGALSPQGGFAERSLMDADSGPITPITSEVQPAASAMQPSSSEQGVQLLIMHAVSGWVAVIHERAVYSIQIAPLGRGNFEVETRLMDGERPGEGSDDPADTLYLRVSCGLGRGKLVRTEVEPLGPRLPRVGN